MAPATGGRGRLRASHADREHVIGMLKAAFVQGRLAKDEFDLRVGQTLASRTCAELAALTADIPAGLIGVTGPPPPRKPARAQAWPPITKVVKTGACVIIAAAAAALAGLAGAPAGANLDTQACQTFFAWANPAFAWANPAVSGVPSLNVVVATARQGSDRNLTGDLEALQQAIRQYENSGGPQQSGPTQQLDQSRVDAAYIQVGADCIPYID
jgi:hypothetical protein